MALGNLSLPPSGPRRDLPPGNNLIALAVCQEIPSRVRERCHLTAGAASSESDFAAHTSYSLWTKPPLKDFVAT